MTSDDFTDDMTHSNKKKQKKPICQESIIS